MERSAIMAEEKGPTAISAGPEQADHQAELADDQEPASARYNGMPNAAIAAETVDYILPPDEMPANLITYVKDFGVRLVQPPPLTQADEAALQKIFIILRSQTGHDFSNYKDSTIKRRISRRMTIHKIERLADYARFLAQAPAEVEMLFKEFLISVTNFFRDPGAFETLQQKVLPQLFNNRSVNQPIRVWVPGCATGEEAYSIAIILKEYMQAQDLNLPVQIFATDIDVEAIEVARWGAYPDGIIVDVVPERLRRFFNKEDHMYHISRDIREMVIFAVQSVIKDPPFSRLDLISCRNLLIYLNENLQQKVIHLFHYSLKKNGFLFLGSSETRGKAEDLFAPFDKKWKIFQRTGDDVSRQWVMGFPYLLPRAMTGHEEVAILQSRPPKQRSPRDIAHNALLAHHTPAGVLVNEEGEVAYYHGQTDRFLKPPEGESPFNVLLMARPGLELELRAAIRKAARQREVVVSDRLQVKHNGGETWVILTVRPLLETSREPLSWTGWLMVLFEEAEPGSTPGSSNPGYSTTGIDQEKVELEQELQAARDRLQSTIEELEASNEDMRSANEELQAANEELQSINEELETSQEELQSANEELVTMNSDFQNQINELAQRNNDLHNLLTNTQIAALFLDLDLRIKLYMPYISKIINLLPSDIGRPLEDLDSRLVHDNLLQDADEVLNTLAIKEMEVQNRDGSWYNLRILPYRTTNNAIEGVVMTFVDITGLREQEVLQRRLNYMASVVATIREPLLILNPELQVVLVNPAFYETFRVDSEETEGRFIYELNGGAWNIPGLRRLLEQIIPRDNAVEDFEIEHNFPELGRRILNLNARRMSQPSGQPELILLTIEDVTERRRLVRRAAREQRYRTDYLESIIATIREPLVVLDTALQVVSANRAFYRLFQVASEETTGRFIYELDSGQWVNGQRELLEQVIPQNNVFEDFEVDHDFPEIGRRTMRLNARRLLQESGQPEMILLAIEDVTGK
jgi:two-component system CheB/CheR fusion protein